jgi:hypothetical protein
MDMRSRIISTCSKVNFSISTAHPAIGTAMASWTFFGSIIHALN